MKLIEFLTVRVLTCLKALFDSFRTRRVDAHKVRPLGKLFKQQQIIKPHSSSTGVHSAYMQAEGTCQDTAYCLLTQRTERTSEIGAKYRLTVVCEIKVHTAFWYGQGRTRWHRRLTPALTKISTFI